MERDGTRSLRDCRVEAVARWELFVVVRRLLSYVLALALFAVAFSIAYGDPPPKQPPEPGITVSDSL
jgi:hypothetical protein